MQAADEAICKSRQPARFAFRARLRGVRDADSDTAPRGPQSLEFEQLHRASGRTHVETAAWLERRLRRPFSHYMIGRYIKEQTALPADVLDAMREIAAQPAEAPPAVVNLTETAEVVPLFGYANAAGASLRLNEDQRVGVVPLHPAQRGSKAAFAFVVFGDSLSPRLRHGDVCYAIFGRTPVPGQPCVIELSAGEALVKIFERANDQTVFGSQLSPKRDLSWPLRDILALHAVVGVSFGSV